MNLDNFPQKNLPKELIDIPLGQIYILTNPNTGITSQDIFMMQFIFSMAKGLNQERVISTMSVDNHLLWGCCICKVQTDQGIQILVANRESIVELLCEYWGLDYEDVSQTYVIKGRYRDNAKISMSGHPMRVALKSQTPGGKATSSSVTLNLLQVPTRSDTIEKIQRNIKDIISYDLDISIEDIVDWFNKELEKKKTYELNIYIEKKKVIVKSKPVMKIKTCDIFLTDSLGNKYPLNFQAEWKVIFLTYIMYKEGLYYSEVDSDEFYSIYEKIHSKMPRIIGAPKRYELEDADQMNVFVNITSKIRKAVEKATNDYKAVELFAIDGDKKGAYRVAGATDEHREMIRKEFGI